MKYQTSSRSSTSTLSRSVGMTWRDWDYWLSQEVFSWRETVRPGQARQAAPTNKAVTIAGRAGTGDLLVI